MNKIRVKPTKPYKSALKYATQKGKKPSTQEIDALVNLFNYGLYAEAMFLAQAMTLRFPQCGFGWKVLGTVLKQMGRTVDALAPMQKAAELSPSDANAYCNLGVTLHDLGRLNEAKASYRRALQISPDYAEAHNNLGNTLHYLGRLDEAEASYRRALQIKPDYAEAHSNLGNTLRYIWRLDDAVASCCRALEIKPDYAEAHNNLGNTLKDLGQLDEAEASYRRALQIKLDYAEAHNNLGNTRHYLGRLDEAEASYRRALQIKPDYAEAYNNLGATLKDLGRLDDSVTSYRRATEIKPDFAEAHNNLGNVLKDLGRLDDAVASYHRAMEIKPDFVEVHSNLLFIHNYLSDLPAALLLAEARHFGDLVARQAHPYRDWRNISESDRCLRVGLVSGDLCNHPVGYFVESVLNALASNAAGRLELIGYPCHFRFDKLTERIKAYCHDWHSAVGLSDENLARQIHEDGIHILIDLSGHTAHNRLPMFAWKPAPVQVGWLGYFATTGVNEMDYVLGDPYVTPLKEEDQFSEIVWRLPESYLCFTPPDVALNVGQLPTLSTGSITFGCFNNLTKMNDAVVALWGRVLQAVPSSRLFLKTRQLNDPAVCETTRQRFAEHRIPSNRLMLEGFSPRADLLAAYNRVDIALDPFPYPGGTTSVEGLWMGVPVVTRRGERFLSHLGESIVQNAGLADWVAANDDDYVAKAVAFASDLDMLTKLRSGLRQQVLASPIFDASRFAHHFEAAMRGMWQRWQKKQGVHT